MTKCLHLYALLMIVLCASCKEKKRTDSSKNTLNSEIKNIATSYGPDAMVRNVKKGLHGTILIAASFAGIFRYDPKCTDGKPFTNLTSTIGSRRFWDVLEDRAGNIWIATTDSGVYFYDQKRLSTKSIQHFTTKDGLGSNAVIDIYEDKSGRIWFATGHGASRYDPKQEDRNFFQNFTMDDGLSGNAIQTIFEDKTGRLWFGTSGEACFYDGEKFTVFRNKDGKAFNNVWGITDDKNGNVWFGATIIEKRKNDTLVVTTGLWRYDGNTFTKISNRGTSALIQDRKGNIWTTGAINPNGAGAWKLFRYDEKTLYQPEPVVTEIMSINKMLCGILEADDGSIWFGSINGVYRYDGKTITDFKNKAIRE